MRRGERGQRDARKGKNRQRGRGDQHTSVRTLAGPVGIAFEGEPRSCPHRGRGGRVQAGRGRELG